jgi:hypothetical protein
MRLSVMDMEKLRSEMVKKKIAPIPVRTLTLQQHWDELRHRQALNDVLRHYL